MAHSKPNFRISERSNLYRESRQIDQYHSRTYTNEKWLTNLALLLPRLLSIT